MKALILNGGTEADQDIGALHGIVRQELSSAGWTVQEFLLRNEAIADCLGCFRCWVQTPGTCVIPDAGREVTAAVIRCDMVVLLTPVTFGGYSSILKKAMDRIIPLASPFFMKINGETHHKQRYDRYPDLFGVGLLRQDDADSRAIFGRLIERNALNFHSRGYSLAIPRNDIGTAGSGFSRILAGRTI
jgi:multimeric flavodoxin WrbA